VHTKFLYHFTQGYYLESFKLGCNKFKWLWPIQKRKLSLIIANSCILHRMQWKYWIKHFVFGHSNFNRLHWNFNNSAFRPKYNTKIFNNCIFQTCGGWQDARRRDSEVTSSVFESSCHLVLVLWYLLWRRREKLAYTFVKVPRPGEGEVTLSVFESSYHLLLPV